jgi:hypothetical protein
MNEPSDHYPFCEPGGENAPAYKSGCATVEPPEAAGESKFPVLEGSAAKKKADCEARRAKGCVYWWKTMAAYCKNRYGDDPTYVEGRMGVCCNKNPGPPAPLPE